MTTEQSVDESRAGPRFLVLMGLFWAGEDARVLSFEALRTSPVSMAYAVALATAAGATLWPLLSDLRRDRAAEGNAPSTGPVWHESTLFTEPWYQVPAIFCVFILFSRFVLDLVAEPPATDQAVWYLAGWGIVVLAAVFGLARDSGNRSKGEEEGGEAIQPTLDEAESLVGTTLRDPWFSVPASSIALLHVARGGLEKIEEEPDSLHAAMWLLMPVGVFVMGLVTVLRVRARERKKEKAAADPVAVSLTQHDRRGGSRSSRG